MLMRLRGGRRRDGDSGSCVALLVGAVPASTPTRDGSAALEEEGKEATRETRTHRKTVAGSRLPSSYLSSHPSCHVPSALLILSTVESMSKPLHLDPIPCWMSLGPSLRWMINGGSTLNELRSENEMNDGTAVSTAVW